jgi:phage terminase large subunit
LETENKYKYSKAYFKIKDLILNNPDEDVFVIRGGQGASKTITIIQLIIQSLLASEKEATILSSELAKMKRTVVRDYKKICKDWGIFKTSNDFNRSESKHEYPNGSYLDFLGADVNDVGKGFRRDILYINEADKMDIETAVQFISRAGLTIIDYNPDSLFWGDDYINENNFITLTYEDNEYLPESEIKSILEYKSKGFYNTDLPTELLFNEANIKSKYWANKWRVYGLGLVGSLDGVVLSNWDEIDELPVDARLLGYGLDFGYSNDPTAITEIYTWNGKRILNELCYQTGLSNAEIAKFIKTRHVCYCDSSEPKSIDELKRHGVNASGVTKGQDSVNFGIQIMQDQSYLITRKSINIKNEFQKYTWAKDRRTNEALNKPIDKFNHAIDGIRYHEMETIGILKPRSIKLRIRG